MMNIPELIKEAHENAVERGFYDCPKCKGSKYKIEKHRVRVNDDLTLNESKYQYRDKDVKIECPNCSGTGIDPNKNIGELLMLIVSELGEALEAHRIGNSAALDTFLYDSEFETDKIKKELFEHFVKDTFEDELADVFIRLFTLRGYLKLKTPIIDHDYSEIPLEINIGESLIIVTEFICYLRENKSYDMDIILSSLSDLCERLNIPIEKHIRAKMAYNRTRPHKHGKEY